MNEIVKRDSGQKGVAVVRLDGKEHRELACAELGRAP